MACPLLCRLFGLSTVRATLTQVTTRDRSVLGLIALQWSIVWLCSNSFVHFTVDRPLGCLCLGLLKTVVP